MTLRGFLTAPGVWLCLAVHFPASTQASAVDYLDVEQLRQSVALHVKSFYQDRFGAQDFDDRVVIEVGSLDPRLKLRECAQPLAMTIKEPPQGQGNITVKTACTSGQRWTIYVPARVDLYAQVAVAAHSLARGHIVSEADMRFQRSNVSQLGAGHVQDPARLLGMELQRPMRAGEAFRLSSLDQPEVVQHGDSVVVEASIGSLTVVAPGKALGSGQVGEQIRVENTQSKRVIDALVVAPGRVKVLL